MKFQTTTPFRISTLIGVVLMFMDSAKLLAAETPDAPDAPPEEVIITGERGMGQMRIQLFEAEKNAYDIFYQFNNERRFRTINGVPPPQMDGTPTPYIPAEVMIASQQKAYQRKLKQVAEEHPEFLNALIELSRLRERYDARMKQDEKQ
jgi:hypothetical protein